MQVKFTMNEVSQQELKELWDEVLRHWVEEEERNEEHHHRFPRLDLRKQIHNFYEPAKLKQRVDFDIYNLFHLHQLCWWTMEGKLVFAFVVDTIYIHYEGRRGALSGYDGADVSEFMMLARDWLREKEDKGRLEIRQFSSQDEQRPWWDSPGCPEREQKDT